VESLQPWALGTFSAIRDFAVVRIGTPIELKLDRRDEGAFAERCRQMRTRLADRAPALAGGSATGRLSASGGGDGSSQAVIAGFSQPSRLFGSFPSFQVFRAPKMTCETDEDNRNRRHGGSEPVCAAGSTGLLDVVGK
jgi:hypothetical protein